MSLVGFTLLGSIEAPTLTDAATGVPLLVKPNTEFTAAMKLKLDVGGGDLRFSSDAAGLNQLPCEVVDGLDVVWVKPTGVSISTGATLYVWGDNTGASQPAVGAAFGRNAVWDDYKGVFHLNESINNTVGGYVDSTGNGFDGTGFNLGSGNGTNPFGQSSTNFDGVNDYIEIPSGMFSPTDSSAFSVMTWAKCSDLASDQRLLFIGESGAGGDDPFGVWMDKDGAGDGWIALVRPEGATNFFAGTDADDDAATEWQHIASTISATEIALYVDGGTPKTTTITETATTRTVDLITLGKLVSGSTTYFYGGVSELWFTLETLSPETIGIVKDNQSITSSWWIASDVGGGSIDVTATLGSINYASNNTTVGVTGSVDVLTTLGTITYTSNNSVVSVTGSVDVITTLGTIDYASNNTTVSVSGAVDVITTLGTIDYASNDAVVGITGSVDVVTTLGTIAYTSNNPIVSIGGVVVVPATLGTISYSSNAVTIGLQGVVDVQTTLGTIEYASNATTVTLAGLIDVTATIGTISYTSNSTTVTVAAGQDFGVVGVGFADDIYGSTFKPDSITVNFRG